VRPGQQAAAVAQEESNGWSRTTTTWSTRPTAIRRQLTAACAAVADANAHGLGLAAMIFVSEDGERMEVFGIDGIDIGDVLEAAAGQQWELRPISPCAGTDAAGGEMTCHRVETDRARAEGSPRPSQASRRYAYPRALAGLSACGPLTTVVGPGCVLIRGEERSAPGRSPKKPTREGDVL
jgi:hypothetical protein